MTADQETMNRVATLLNMITGSASNSDSVNIRTRIFEVPDQLVIEDTPMDAAGVEAFVSDVQSDLDATIVSLSCHREQKCPESGNRINRRAGGASRKRGG